MIEIDGSYHEGGGQILRTAIALSSVTGKSCKIFNIRKGRTKPGLKAQHLTSIEAAAELCNGKLKGARPGSTEIRFEPNEINGGRIKIDIGTAGSVTLALQTLIIPALHAKSEVILEVTGGTDVSWSPTITYFQHIFCDFLRKMGIDIFVDIIRRGFYPKGGGKVIVRIRPIKELVPLFLVDRGKLLYCDAWSIASEQLREPKVAERQIEGASKHFDFRNENILYCDTLSTGSSIHLHAHFMNTKIGADNLGERGRPAEKVGEECALLLKKQLDSNACLDRWMADQILPYLALAGKGKVSVSEITGHSLTNIWTIEKFLPVKFSVEGKKGGSGTISVS